MTWIWHTRYGIWHLLSSKYIQYAAWHPKFGFDAFELWAAIGNYLKLLQCMYPASWMFLQAWIHALWHLKLVFLHHDSWFQNFRWLIYLLIDWNYENTGVRILCKIMHLGISKRFTLSNIRIRGHVHVL